MCLYLSWWSKFQLAVNAFLICLTAAGISELISAISITDGNDFNAIFSLMVSQMNENNLIKQRLTIPVRGKIGLGKSWFINL